MTNTLDSNPPVADPQRPAPPAAPAPPPARPARGRERTPGHIIAIVVGCLLLLPGLGLLAGGTTVAIGQAVATDDDGYFRFTLDRIDSDGVAVATTDLWLDDVESDAGPWVFDFLDVDLRLRVQGAEGTDEVFVGIARSADLDRYLADAAYSEVVEVDDRTPRYEQIIGDGSVDPPTDQDFWTVSAAGTGEQELDWQARGGRWSVVVMNADGTPGVAADVEVGARSGAVTPVAISLIVAGGILALIAGSMIIIGARGRRRLPDERPAPVPSGAIVDNPPPPAA